MYNSYLILFRLCREIKPELKGKFLISVHSQEKDIFHVTIGESYNAAENLVLEFSSVSHSPYLLQRKYFKPAGKNLIYFFKDLLPQRIIDIKISFGERNVMLILETGFLLISLRGKDSNIFFVETGSVDVATVRKSNLDVSTLIDSGYTFLDPGDTITEKILDIARNSIDPLREMPFLGKDLIREVKARSTSELAVDISQVVDSVLTDKLLLVRDSVTGSIHIRPESFHHDMDTVSIHSNVVTALQEYVATSRKQTATFNLRKRVLAGIKRDLEFYSQKEVNLLEILDSEDRSYYYDKIANLLMINMQSIPKGTETARVMDIFDIENEILIPLKSDLTVNQNIDRYFRKARGEKLKFENARASLSETRQKIVDLKTKLNLFETMDADQLKETGKQIKSSAAETRQYPNNARIRRFVLDAKWEVLVGKDSESNDTLTLKVAKQSDYWFHARGSSGSHTVLRYSGKEKPPKEIIRKVAQIAAFYSKAKNSKLVPVAYTQKKYVGKRKGMNPGQVFMLREEVVMVPPEIPVGCEQENED